MSSLKGNMDQATESTVDYILLVEFHHKNGPQVQFSYPPLPGNTDEGSNELPEAWISLPFMALPEGVHNRMEETVYFHLPILDGSDTAVGSTQGGTMFCVASFRQIDANLVENKNADVTRSYVQKSVVFMSRIPVYGLLSTKLNVFSDVLFAQRDFTSIDMLKQCYHQVNNGTKVAALLDDPAETSMASLRSLVKKFRYKLLVLVKLLLLEKRVLTHGSPVRDLCSGLVALVALVPDLFASGLDGVCELEHTAFHKEYFTEKDTDSFEQKLHKRLGLPFVPFSKDCLFQPYLTLQDADLIYIGNARSFLVGTTNALLLSHNKIPLDAVVDFEIGTVKINGSALNDQLRLTTEDLRFMDKITSEVDATWVSEGPDAGRDALTFNGSNAWVRKMFENYMQSYIATYLDFITAATKTDRDKRYDGITTFNSDFVNGWSTTSNYAAWKSVVDPTVLSSVTAGHPNRGKWTFADAKIQLNNKMFDNMTEEQVKEAQKQADEAGIALKQASTEVSAAWLSAKSSVSGWFTKKKLQYDAYQTPAQKRQPEVDDGPPSRPKHSPPPSTSFLTSNQAEDVRSPRPSMETDSSFLSRSNSNSPRHRTSMEMPTMSPLKPSSSERISSPLVPGNAKDLSRPPAENAPAFLSWPSSVDDLGQLKLN
ncbi:hypothetical protein SARC_09045 [Sphaeroforma arctica JP610]|uniref:UDENN domain-containing protein n=1 Tax=Sphaeroforma arctica JP610 TaxID=667725 RepID=A0A0L0FPU2_9EUKA|nr:hypothetical protein SARC_09045 [Sphaeroforma arctica JP610]KNC78531.1 hypothetical protein SARC_09045 [Sphaeroforma arctica JP610]|eukprot:XP_014152433.1 hypothetical protein SARC_09045 [Sphaeroforma arctica JP610]